MLYLYVLAIVLHVATAAAWFGLSLKLPRLARGIPNGTPEEGKILAASGLETITMMDRFVVLMYLLAFLAILLGPGFGGIGWNYHLALGLGGMLILVHVFLIRKAWNALVASIGGDTAPTRKRLAMSLGVGHLLWMTLLVLMFVPRLAV